MNNLTIEKRSKGRPPMIKQETSFNPTSIEVITGAELEFDEAVFTPMQTGTVMDVILSTNGGLMPATNIVLCGGPGSGKSTLVLDMLANMTRRGKRCLFVSGEMDEIGHYKYCRRMVQFANVPTLFLKNYSVHVKQTLEHVFESGYDVIAIDSVAEILDMYKDTYKTTESAAELWFLDLQTKHKKGGNSNNKYTAFINIQQVTKAGEFAGSNRLKHMTDAMASIKREKDSDTRIVQFSKNRDCDVEQKITFRIGLNQLEYGFEMAE